MKRKKDFVNSRRTKILNTVREIGKIKVEELATMFNVSVITIRRDLQYLEDNKMLTRFYGGAELKNVEQEILTQDSEVNLYKSLIAKYASTLIKDNDTVFLNSSSTSLKILDFVKREYVTFITNNAKAISVNLKANSSIILTGGEIRHPKEVLVGDYALKNVESIYAKKAFIGCSGVSLKCGMTTANANEVNINKAMIKNARETYFLADHIKLNRNSSFISCDISEINHLITDEKAPDETINLFKERGITVHIVKK